MSKGLGLALTFLLFLVGNTSFGADYPKLQGPSKPVLTIDDELKAAYIHLDGVNQHDRQFIKFLTFMAYPEDVRDDAVLVTSFWLHSLTGVPDKELGGNSGYYAPIAFRIKLPNGLYSMIYKQRVKGSQTLYWIDIRDYNWTETAWEKVSVAEPHVRKPVVSEEVYDAIRLLSGNAVVRADWFLANTGDVTKQADFDSAAPSLNKCMNEPFYYVLLYANAKIPRNANEFRDIWGVNLQRINDLQQARGCIVDREKSVVSRNARELARAPLDGSYHWESSDFKHNRGKNDPIEFLSVERDKKGKAVHVNIGRKSDAHEYISKNLQDLQVYFLSDGKEDRVEFADPTIVRDTSDRLGDIRVRTPRSCVVCHPQGINIPSDALRDYLNDGVDLVIGTYEYRQAVKQFYLTDLGALIQDDQVKYARGVVQTNGLLPEENSRKFQKIMDWYDKGVSLEQAARECGVSVDEFKERVGRAAKGRLDRLVKSEDPTYTIPRHLWDDPETGDYQLAMLLIHDLGGLQVSEIKETTQKVVDEIKPPHAQPVPQTKIPQTLTVIKDGAEAKLGYNIIDKIKIGTKFSIIDKVRTWYKVDLGDKGRAYISETDVRID